MSPGNPFLNWDSNRIRHCLPTIEDFLTAPEANIASCFRNLTGLFVDEYSPLTRETHYQRDSLFKVKTIAESYLTDTNFKNQWVYCSRNTTIDSKGLFELGHFKFKREPDTLSYLEKFAIGIPLPHPENEDIWKQSYSHHEFVRRSKIEKIIYNYFYAALFTLAYSVKEPEDSVYPLHPYGKLNILYFIHQLKVGFNYYCPNCKTSFCSIIDCVEEHQEGLYQKLINFDPNRPVFATGVYRYIYPVIFPHTLLEEPPFSDFDLTHLEYIKGYRLERVSHQGCIVPYSGPPDFTTWCKSSSVYSEIFNQTVTDYNRFIANNQELLGQDDINPFSLPSLFVDKVKDITQPYIRSIHDTGPIDNPETVRSSRSSSPLFPPASPNSDRLSPAYSPTSPL